MKIRIFPISFARLRAHVAGEKAGSKLDKAQKLGVKVISEADFEKLIK